MKIVAEQPLAEIILRKYELPQTIKERELVKKLCLALGLLQPGDSRDVVVDVFHVLLKSKKRRKLLSVAEIEKKVIQNRKLHKVPMLGIASSNIRRQIKRLRNLLLIEKIKTGYRVSEFMPLQQLFSEKIETFILPNIIQRIKKYFEKADELFAAKKK
ncbi:hypothetical protein CMO88_03785 [Candidatus Woesearchaeota archaeon]|nr:hypothetical protein [Candidatus Woesearchaeota archaeon]|tara:strand:+ start:23282 stop:23755 length:474 start_codon:yes stop_codon:yes gene_type:complete